MINNECQSTTLDAVYQKLTGINIGEQIDEWDARGKGYYGEFLLFSEIYKYIPGCFKILMNLRIPSEYGKTTEIDLLLIHETGLYVFEAKHYKSTIYGKVDDAQWTQYFKTVKNNCFPNPLYQNRWHIEHLRKLVPNCPIHSFIVFTSPECELKVTGSLPNTTLCKKSDMLQYFWGISRQSKPILSVQEIDDIFSSLKIYSPMQDTLVDYEDNKSIGFYQFIEMMSTFHSEQKAEAEQKYKAREEELIQKYSQKEEELTQKYIFKEKANQKEIKKINRRTSSICAAVILFFFVLTSSITSSNQQKNQDAISIASAQVKEYQNQMEQYKNDADASREELQKFMQKWEIVTDFQIDGEKLKENYVVVDHVSLTNSADVGDVVYLAFSITHNGEDFYVLIDKSSMFTIVLKDGRVIETPCYSGYYSYSLGYSKTYKTLEVKNLEFSGFNAEDVAFIKMTNMQIKRIKYVYGEKPLLTDYEIVLYEAK